ncbi:MAG: hypothetical protein WCJ72_10220, partial [Chryseobacterium sp.]
HVQFTPESGVQFAPEYPLTEKELREIYLMFFPEPKISSLADIISEKERNERLKALRASVLTDAQYVGYHDPGSWAVFNNFMLTLSPLKKPLKNYQIEEFPALIRQMKSIRQKFDTRSKIPGTKEWYIKNKLPIPSSN